MLHVNACARAVVCLMLASTKVSPRLPWLPPRMCRRKKDHGRAEALLMAAWAMGVRMQPIETSDSAAAAGEAESAEEDSD